MRIFAPALALAAGVFISPRAHAEDKLPAPKLVLDDVVGFGTTGNTGWFGYNRSGITTGDKEVPGLLAGARSKSSSLFVAPRFEALFGEYLSLGAQVAYMRFASGTDYSSASAAQSSSTESNRFTLVPIVGVRIPLPHRLSLWGHLGFGGGAAITHSERRSDAAPTDVDTAQLVTTFRSDVRVGYEPIRGLMLVAGPELQRTVVAQTSEAVGTSQLNVGVWAGVSFVIR
jgi:hypothetical protein